MRDIILITLSTPTKTNYRTASALPYHIALNREKDVNLTIYSFNLNNANSEIIEKSSKELNCTIKILDMPWWYNLIFKMHLLFLRIFLPYPFFYYFTLPENISRSINKDDVVWIYGEDIAHLAKGIDNKCIVTTPDCEAMYYYRLLSLNIGNKSVTKFMRYSLAYRKYLRLIRKFPTRDNIKYHLVGYEDLLFLKNINPDTNAYFLRHPHYETIERESIKFKGSKIKILIAGRNDLYQHLATDIVIQNFLKHQELSEQYDITFLGKGWEEYTRILNNAGYKTIHKGYVEDYIKEITQHDIQITAITVGTGTKGKVLDAFANGLLVIGNKFALENINVENGVSCLSYDTPEDLNQILHNIASNRTRYEIIAKKGMEEVLNYHNSQKISNQFYKLIES